MVFLGLDKIKIDGIIIFTVSRINSQGNISLNFYLQIILLYKPNAFNDATILSRNQFSKRPPEKKHARWSVTDRRMVLNARVSRDSAEKIHLSESVRRRTPEEISISREINYSVGRRAGIIN